ncbi:unnamed protein product [Sphagnum jensenii]
MAANSATNGDGLSLDIPKAAPKEDAANGGMVVPPAALKNSAVTTTTTTTTEENSAPRMEPEDQLDSGERRLNELGYKQELRREMTLFKCMAIAFSTMTLFTGIVPLYGSSLMYAGPVGLVWGWVVVTFFTWFVGFAMSEICSSFPVSFFTTIQIFFPNLIPSFSCCKLLHNHDLLPGDQFLLLF